MQLRIATFNLESLDDRPGLEPPLAARIAVLRPQLERLRADVLCLQEVNGQPSGHHAPRRLLALDALIAECMEVLGISEAAARSMASSAH